jgi:NAD(P)-dependent dehydrogenase (short-subunit alcohol dehydrogenase family)
VQLEGKVALITGASRGIGLSVAQRLVADGAQVCLTARRPDGVAAAVELLGGAGRALGIPGKADDPEHREQAVQQTLDTFGRLDFLVNNAGINPMHGPVLDVELAAARKLTEVNVLAALAWTQAAHRAWLAEHGGAVVNVASVSGLRPAAGIGLYGATKAMLINLTQALALELSPRVRVNAVAPAIVKTAMAAALYDGQEDVVAGRYPLGRLGAPEDVAGTVAFLLSEDSGWITGQTLVVDGGLSLTSKR